MSSGRKKSESTKAVRMRRKPSKCQPPRLMSLQRDAAGGSHGSCFSQKTLASHFGAQYPGNKVQFRRQEGEARLDSRLPPRCCHRVGLCTQACLPGAPDQGRPFILEKDFIKASSEDMRGLMCLKSPPHLCRCVRSHRKEQRGGQAVRRRTSPGLLQGRPPQMASAKSCFIWAEGTGAAFTPRPEEARRSHLTLKGKILIFKVPLCHAGCSRTRNSHGGQE